MLSVKKISISVITLLVTTFLMIGNAHAESSKLGIITGDVVNLRANPSTSAKILVQLKEGTKVSVIGSEGNWYKVSYSNSTGWINDKYIMVQDKAISKGVVTGSVVNVRSNPDISAEILTKVKKGDIVEIFEKTENWLRISIGEKRYGWVHGDYIKIQEEKVSRGGAVDIAASSNETDNSEDGSIDEMRKEIVDYAKKFLGVKYVYGGSTPKGFDCSGFVCYVYSHFGITLERASRDMGRKGKTVSKSDLKPGDLVFFDTNGGLNGINHVGIYIGNNQFIHASSASTKKVTINSLSDAYYSKRFMVAKDYLSK